MGRALRLLSDVVVAVLGGKMLSCSRSKEPDTAALARRRLRHRGAGETGENSSGTGVCTVVHCCRPRPRAGGWWRTAGQGGGVCGLADRPSRRRVTMWPVMGTAIESRCAADGHTEIKPTFLSPASIWARRAVSQSLSRTLPRDDRVDVSFCHC